jgi:O-antigen/teichoic acid export membrane protein
MLLVTMMYALLQWSPNIILGFFAPSAEVGIFALAARTAMLATFAVSAVNWLAAPNFAAFHKRDDLDSLRRAIQHATLLMLVFGGPVIIFLLAFPTPIMGLFGEEFHGGANSLVILTLGGLINTACGPAGTVLIMTGHERTMRDITLLALGVNWTLSFLLAPAYGSVGIAVAVSAGVAVQNILGVLIVYRRFGILTLPIRRLKVVV